MKASIKKALLKAERAEQKLHSAISDFAIEAQKVCGFDVSACICAGDGVLLNTPLDDILVANPRCLEGKTEKNKLTFEEFKKFTL